MKQTATMQKKKLNLFWLKSRGRILERITGDLNLRWILKHEFYTILRNYE